uniref:Uncharacterized protein n=1 Tax=Glossina brevipalpis TaxID=37001 RepID=A0A1A9W2D1_9MUSC
MLSTHFFLRTPQDFWVCSQRTYRPVHSTCGVRAHVEIDDDCLLYLFHSSLASSAPLFAATPFNLFILVAELTMLICPSCIHLSAKAFYAIFKTTERIIRIK